MKLHKTVYCDASVNYGIYMQFQWSEGSNMNKYVLKLSH